MIGKLKGILDSYNEDSVILDVNGVGYIVHCSGRTLQNLPKPGEAISLLIETHVREDMIRLYGFHSDAERDWFKLLQSVQGVGSRVAIGLLSILDTGTLASAIATGDKTTVSRGPGVGPKLAQRIVSELKDKVPAFSAVDPAVMNLSGMVEEGGAGRPVLDAISALVNLGYGRPQASAAIAAALKQAGEDAEAKTLIRFGLKELAR